MMNSFISSLEASKRNQTQLSFFAAFALAGAFLLSSCSSLQTKNGESRESSGLVTNVTTTASSNTTRSVHGNSAYLEREVNRNLTGRRDKHGFPGYEPGAEFLRVRTTAYTHSEADHLKYGKKTAIGTELRHGRIRSCAADWSVFPLGTTFQIQGLPYVFVVDDYGSALVGTNTIDVYTANREVMNQWGVRTVDIQVLRWGSFDRSAQILEDRVRYSHCRRMYNEIRQRRLRS